MALLCAPRDRVVPKYPQCPEAMDLLEQLLEVCHLLGIAPRHLQDAGAEAAPVRALLKEAQGLWQEGRAELALQLLEAVQVRGLRHGWIDDHRARCLLQLQRHEEAEAIWQQLAADQDDALKTAAEAMLKRLQLEEQQPAFRAAAQQLAARFDLRLQRLSAEQQPSAAFEHTLLEEAIAAREADQAGFSLALMDLALEKGYRSPWLQDNRARALVQLERFEEACDAWREMAAASDDAEIQAMVAELLAHYSPAVKRQRNQRLALERVQQAEEMVQSGRINQAVSLLRDALLNDPESEVIEKGLISVLKKRRSLEDPFLRDIPDWLLRQELFLEMTEIMFSEISDQLGASPTGRFPEVK